MRKIDFVLSGKGIGIATQTGYGDHPGSPQPLFQGMKELCASLRRTLCQKGVSCACP